MSKVKGKALKRKQKEIDDLIETAELEKRVIFERQSFTNLDPGKPFEFELVGKFYINQLGDELAEHRKIIEASALAAKFLRVFSLVWGKTIKNHS